MKSSTKSRDLETDDFAHQESAPGFVVGEGPPPSDTVSTRAELSPATGASDNTSMNSGAHASREKRSSEKRSPESPSPERPSPERLSPEKSSPKKPSREKPSALDLFCQKVVLNSLTGMRRGSLDLKLPDGTSASNGSVETSCTAHIEINSYDFFKRCVKYGAIGFAEGYIDGEWTTTDLTDVIRWFILNLNDSTVMEGSKNRNPMLDLFNFVNRLGHLSRPNSKKISKSNIEAHYDLSNEFFSLFLDKSMTYSSAIFTRADEDLFEAQQNKYKRICESLMLNESDHLLEIGCGWGGLAVYAARNYGCKITGITISPSQFEYATKRIKNEGLENQVQILLTDYRDLTGHFDKIASIEMVEALGDKYVETYFKKCAQLLKHDGLMTFQLIVSPDSRYDLLRGSVDFIQKHIFPGSLLLSTERVIRATSKVSDLHMVEFNEFAESYAHTLRLWRDNFEQRLNEVRALGFSEKFIRKWIYYLCYCEAAFDMRQISVAQITISRPNNQFVRQSKRLG
ncbi:MAG: class I SAM-dependent methyltransferase [Candidatus Melainabacteria bacterium]|nr:class I SAM-dependent methyltransferase [Candidatus Melainabacteria bacterium]